MDSTLHLGLEVSADVPVVSRALCHQTQHRCQAFLIVGTLSGYIHMKHERTQRGRMAEEACRCSSKVQYLVYPLFHKVQQHLHCVHVLPTILFYPTLDRDVYQNIQALHGKVTQEIYGMTRRNDK